MSSLVFFFNDTATTEIYTLSLHDALPICPRLKSSLSATSVTSRLSVPRLLFWIGLVTSFASGAVKSALKGLARSEEHTSVLQSRLHLVCRLLLEKKKESRLMLPVIWLMVS